MGNGHVSVETLLGYGIRASTSVSKLAVACLIWKVLMEHVEESNFFFYFLERGSLANHELDLYYAMVMV